MDRSKAYTHTLTHTLEQKYAAGKTVNLTLSYSILHWLDSGLCSVWLGIVFMVTETLFVGSQTARNDKTSTTDSSQYFEIDTNTDLNVCVSFHPTPFRKVTE